LRNFTLLLKLNKIIPALKSSGEFASILA